MVLKFLSRASLLFLAFGFCFESAYCNYDVAPNIIVFMADDLGWNDVGFHGSNQIPTPNIDALAYNGIILNKHYVLPSCTPTRAAFFSGKYPIRMGMQGDGILGGEPRGLPLNVRILPEYLRELGYTSKLIGKWHLGFLTLEHTPTYRGFDSFLGYYNSYISYYDYKYSQGQNMSGFDMHRDEYPAHDLRDVYATELFTREAVKIIDEHKKLNPLYLQISHLGVHAPLEVPRDYFNGHSSFKHIKDTDRAKYAKMVNELDNSLGDIVSALGRNDMLRDSIILFLTDNGAPTIGRYRNSGSNWPLRGTKYTLYEGGVRGVAAIWSPKLKNPASVSTDLIHVTDWLPTLFAAAGGDVSVLGNIDGINQWPYLSKGTEHQRDEILLNIDNLAGTEAAIYKKYKLIRGSYRNGKHDYDQYIGESGQTGDTPEYDTGAVRDSLVSNALKTYFQSAVTQPSTMWTLRQNATVICLRRNQERYQDRYQDKSRYQDKFAQCNETGCLFDIERDPCETTNVASSFHIYKNQLDRILEKYYNLTVRQPRAHIDWMADPQRRNNTWAPWLTIDDATRNDPYGFPNAATAIGTLAVCAHIGMLLLSVSLRAFI